MLKDKIRATDWEATNEEIEEQIARESYMEWLQLQENQLRIKKKPTASATYTKYVEDENSNVSPKSYSPRATYSSKSPQHDRSLRSPLRCNSNEGGVESEKQQHLQHQKPSTSSASSRFDIDEAASFLRDVPPSALGKCTTCQDCSVSSIIYVAFARLERLGRGR